MEITTVVNISNSDYDVYIGRPSKWGNPFVIGKDGSRQAVLSKYREYLLNNSQLMKDIMQLDGKILGCHCKPAACHGDILIEIIEQNHRNALYDDE